MKTERIPDQLDASTTHRILDGTHSMDDSDSGTTMRIGDANSRFPDDDYSISIGKKISLNQSNYQIIKLITSSGESEIFLVEDETGKEYVLKYYFSNYKPKDEVIEKLQKIKNHPIIYPIDYGTYNKRFWEINEYMLGGTWEDVFPIQDTLAIKEIVSQVNEVINICHQNRIIHRDVKPSNFFFADKNQTKIILGDFGIASPMQDNTDYRVTLVHKTPTYAAPELFTNIDKKTIIDTKVDYYALGISVLEAWIGGNPFKGIADFNIMRIKMEGKVKIPKDIPTEIESLIKGLITTEPPKRWGYEEVVKWLNGVPVKVHYHTHHTNYSPYEFDRLNGSIAKDPLELAGFMELNQKKAEQQLYSGSIAEWVKSSSQDLFSELYHIVEREYKATSAENIEAGITKAIYILDKDRPFKTFDGTLCSSPPDIAHHMEKNILFYKKDLIRAAHSSFYIFLESRGYHDRAEKFRNYFKKLTIDQAIQLTIIDLQENKLLFNGETFENVSQLMNAPVTMHPMLLQGVADKSSKISVWLDSNHPELSDNLTIWRDLDHLNMETLGYALKTNGIKFKEESILNASDFKAFLEANLNLFFDDPSATQNRISAEYWLKNYQNTTIIDALINLDHPFGVNSSKELFLSILDYLLLDHAFSNVHAFFMDISSFCHNDGDLEDRIAEKISQSFGDYLNVLKTSTVFKLDALENVFPSFEILKNDNENLSTKIATNLNDVIFEFIHSDLYNLKSNSDSYFIYRDRLSSFVENTLVKIASDLPYIEHWRKEEKLISEQKNKIGEDIEKDRLKEVQKVNQGFDKFVTDSHKNTIDFIGKGKSIYTILLILICWGIAFLGISSELLPKETLAGKSFNDWFANFMILLFIIGPIFMAYRIRKRIPNKGLGVIFDPIYSFLGKKAYKPFIHGIMTDDSHIVNQKAVKEKQAEMDKLQAIYKGKKLDIIFQESVRIVLLPDDHLTNEINKL